MNSDAVIIKEEPGISLETSKKNEDTPFPMVSIPIDVLWQMNARGVQNLNRNGTIVKKEPVESTDNSSTSPTELCESQRCISSKDAIGNSVTPREPYTVSNMKQQNAIESNPLREDHLDQSPLSASSSTELFTDNRVENEECSRLDNVGAPGLSKNNENSTLLEVPIPTDVVAQVNAIDLQNLNRNGAIVKQEPIETIDSLSASDINLKETEPVTLKDSLTTTPTIATNPTSGNNVNTNGLDLKTTELFMNLLPMTTKPARNVSLAETLMEDTVEFVPSESTSADCPVIKKEPASPTLLNSEKMQEPINKMTTRPPRNVSAADTLMEEPIGFGKSESTSADMVSPVIKIESATPTLRNSEEIQELIDQMTTRPPRNVSPAETLMEKPIGLDKSGSTSADSVSPIPILEREPTTPTLPNSEKKRELDVQITTKPPRNVSPSGTLMDEPIGFVKSESISVDMVSPTEIKPPSPTLLNSEKIQEPINQMTTRPPRYVSPADTLLEEPIGFVKSESTSADTASPIEIEPASPTLLNSEKIQEPINQMTIRPPRNVSPADTLMEEPIGFGKSESTSADMVSPAIKIESATPTFPSSEEIQELIDQMAIRPPRNVNSAETLMEEPIGFVKSESTISKKKQDLGAYSHSPTVTDVAREPSCMQADLRRGRSPTGAVIEAASGALNEADLIFDANGLDPSGSLNDYQLLSSELRPQRDVIPAVTFIEEPVNSESVHTVISTFIPKPMSPQEPVKTEERPILNATEDSLDSCTESTFMQTDFLRRVSPTGTVIEIESSPEMQSPPLKKFFSASPISRHYSAKRRLSPTGTIVKDERENSDILTNCEEDLYENLSNSSLPSWTSSPKHREGSSKNSSRKRRRSRCDEKHATKEERSYKSRSDDDRSRESSSSRKRSRKSRHKSRKSSRNSKKRRKSKKHDSNNRVKHSHTKSERKRKYDRERRSGKRTKKEREPNDFETEIDESMESPTDGYQSPLPSQYKKRRDRRLLSRIKSESKTKYDGHRRSGKRSKMERNPYDYDTENEPSVDSPSDGYQSPLSSQYKRRRDRRLLTRIKSESKTKCDRDRRSGKRSKMERNPNDSETEIEASKASPTDGYQSPLPGTSKGKKENVANRWASVRFSLSSESSPRRKSEQKDDEDSDYGWKYPAPPKPQPDVEQDNENLTLTEKLKNFNKYLKTEYDLTVIEERKNTLIHAIEETITIAAHNKVIELDVTIQKKKDDYVRKLFGTDDFDKWNDNPALSNVNMTQKLKLMPGDAPLMDKITMRRSTNAMRLTPASDKNELISNGRIRKIETEFLGREPPTALVNEIKQEKAVIFEVVRKWLMPYYNNGRIQPKNLFGSIAKKVCHAFYERVADEIVIKTYIDDLFQKVGTITSTRDFLT